jgi:mono/diheme cytochrome c family protein
LDEDDPPFNPLWFHNLISPMFPIKPHRQVLLFSFLILFSAGMSACSLAEDITPPPGYREPTAVPQSVASGPVAPAAAPDPSQGAAIYAVKCAPCHGTDGLGDGPQAANLANPPAAIGSATLARAAKPADWFNIISQGRIDRFMPGFSQSLSDQERWDVVAYVFTLSNPAGATPLMAAVYQAQCASCHGAQGKGGGTPSASSASTDLTDPAWQASQAGADIFQEISSGKGQMPAFASQLTEDQRWGMVGYIRSLGSASQPLAAAGSPSAPSGPLAVNETPAATLPGAAGPQATPLANAPAVSGAAVSSFAGQIKNGSGGEVPAGLPVTLHGYDSMQETITQTATTGADGKYSFAQVAVPSGRVFMISVTYKNAVFNSDIVSAQAGSQATNLPVTIYEPTTDTSTLSVDRMHVFFDFSNPGIVQVVQLFVVSNTGKKAVVSAGPGKAIMTFALPTGATGLQFQQGEMGRRYVATADGFGDTQSVPPGSGQAQVLFAYNLPYSRKAEIALPITMAVPSAVVMVPKVGVSAQGTGLQDGGDRDVQGVTFHLYTVNNLAAGGKLDLTLSGDPNSTGQNNLISGGSLLTLEIGLVVFALVIGLSTLWLIRTQRRAAKARIPAAPAGVERRSTVREAENADTLIDAIIALDDLYQAGKLPEPAYRERRAELKARLGEKIQ